VAHLGALRRPFPVLGLEASDGKLGLAPLNNGLEKLVAVFKTNEDGPFAIKAVTSSGICHALRSNKTL
jgi:hypothetical protein